MDKKLDYSNLKELLENETWPRIYMFKFIVPFEPESLNMLKELFDDDAKIKHRESSDSNYIAFTAKQRMQSSTAVIEVYKQAEQIDKIIAL